MGTCPDLRFHISQVIIFHITPHHFYISQRCQAVQMWPLCTKMTLDSNSSQCSPIVGLFHSALPKSAHNLAQPSGKGLQTADNWLELELNSIFVQKTSLYCLIMLCNVGVVVERWGKWWPGKCGNVDWEKYLSNLVQTSPQAKRHQSSLLITPITSLFQLL